MQQFHFKSNEAAFDVACKFMDTKIKKGGFYAALVVDPNKELKEEISSTPIKILEDGRQVCLLKVASSEGGFLLMSQTPTSEPKLAVGDLVGWVAYKKPFLLSLKLGKAAWIGIIGAKLKPAHGPEGWEIEQSFIPEQAKATR